MDQIYHDVADVRLFEREGEVARIDEALREARTGTGTLVLIEGPGGIGKTELVLVARRLGAASGMVVASARGSVLERELAFGIVRQLLDPIVTGARSAARKSLFAEAARLAEPIFEVGSEADFTAGRPEDQAFAMMHGLHWLCQNAAKRAPLLLAVDDAHWSDLASLRFLVYLAQRRDDFPVAIVVATRPAENSAEEELLVGLATDPRVTAIAPSPLSRHAASDLLRAELNREPEEAFTAACHRATGGTPFLLRELARVLRAEEVEPNAAASARIAALGPRSVARSVLARIRRLGAPALAVAHAVATLDADAEPRRVARLADSELDAVSAAIDALVRVGVLRPGRPVAFAHPIVCAAVYAEAPVSERARLHALAAAELTRDGAPDERIASHLLATDPAADADVAQLLLRVARVARVRGAPATAQAYLRRALAEAPSGELLVDVLCEAGRAEIAVGQRAAFAEHLVRAIDACEQPRRRAEIALDLGPALAFAGDVAGAVAVLDEALVALGGTESSLAQRLEAELFVAALMHYPSVEVIRERLLARVAQLDAGMLDDPALAIPAAHTLVMVRPPAAHGAAIIERLAQDEPEPESPLIGFVGDGLAFAGRFRCSADWFERAVRIASERGWRLSLAWVLAGRASLSLQLGNVARAEVEAAFALDAMREVSAEMGMTWTAATLIEALLVRGAMAEAEDVVASLPAVETFPPTYLRSRLLAARGRLRLAQGDAAGALADAVASGEGLSRRANPAARQWRSDAAWALRRLDRLAEAREHAAQELALAREFDVPHAIGGALRTLAACADAEEAVALLHDAVRVLADSEARLEHAHALVDYGAALRRANRRVECREPLRRGHELAQSCGAAPLADRARTELLATGARPRSAMLAGVESLTASERRVAELACAGMTNREIAQELFVTPRTVEGHLTHVFRKLGIGSRREIAERLKPSG